MEQTVVRTGRMLPIIMTGLFVWLATAWAVDAPCDTYPTVKQARCAEMWKELNREDGPIIAQFGLEQQKRRDAGTINAQQHLAENMTFIKQSTEKRLARLKDRMSKESP
jgi:hypothetical protein